MEEKSCGCCKNYHDYYVISNEILRKTSHGFCVEIHRNGHFRKADKPCEHWEMREGVSEANIIKKLERMSEQINDIALILRRE